MSNADDLRPSMDTEAVQKLVADFESKLAEREMKIDALLDSLGRQAGEIHALKGLLMQSRVMDVEAE